MDRTRALRSRVVYITPGQKCVKERWYADPARANMCVRAMTRPRTSHAGNRGYKSRGTQIPRQANMRAELDRTTHTRKRNI